MLPTPLSLQCSEADLQNAVIHTAKLLGIHVTHFRPSKTQSGRWVTALQGHPGFPDLVLAHSGKVLLAELKRHGQYPTPAQRGWLEALGEYGRLWTTTDWNDGTITGELMRFANKSARSPRR